MNYKYDFLEGMGSIYDLKGENHFNEFTNYPDTTGAIRRVWFNVGCHLDNSTNQLGQNNGLTKSNVKRRNLFKLSK